MTTTALPVSPVLAASARPDPAEPRARTAPAPDSPPALEARDRVLLYTSGLELDPVEGVELALQSLRQSKDASGGLQAQEAMRSLYDLLRRKGVPLEARDRRGQPLRSAPALHRSSMLAEEMELNPLRGAIRRCLRNVSGRPAKAGSRPCPPRPAGPRPAWERAGSRRRMLLLALILLPSLFSAQIMYSLLPRTAWEPLLLTITALFAVLFCWISVGFWSSVAGIVVMLRRYDRFSLTASVPEQARLPEDARTALLFPVYNENARTVCAGIRTVWQSLRAAGIERHFDVFILSDSTSADAWVNEEEAWRDLCRAEQAEGRIFYRRRRSNLKRKSGNVADFCRRWGADYRYMVVFDADSLMSARTLERMVLIMEANPTVGIVQSPPKAIKSRSLLARVQQFANHLYGPIFAAGLHYWQLGDAQYWGHNAIIRVEPFMRHCQLPKLPGRAPLGGEIMSHDFVESALMRRAGYGVWLAYDLDGSYEQAPPSLIDELVRDRRWCQGNLQHSRLIFTKGFFPTHRALFINGIMSYGSAFLWLLFLLSSSAQALVELFVVPDYFPAGPSLFPDWPRYFPNWALTLLSSTAALLFLPKLLALILVTAKGGTEAFGGFVKMSLSVVGEVVVSTFLAPVRMLFHSWFVIGALLGRSFGWNAQNRDDKGTAWADAVRFHWWGSVLGCVWGWFMYLINPGFFLWLSPVVAGLALSVPLSVWTSRVSWGEAARKAGLFLTPADTRPDRELLLLEQNLDRPAPYNPFSMREGAGFVRAVVVPSVFALHNALTRRRQRASEALRALVDKARDHGPAALNNAEKLTILSNPDCLEELHHEVWSSDREQAERWGIV